MNRKVIVLLALVFAFGLVGCTGNVPASSTNTVVAAEPTVTLPPTALPTEVPIEVSPTPTLEPSLTPTEVPLYVGLPADEVEALREQCLQENTGSLCLPLPMDPSGLELTWVEETWEWEGTTYHSSSLVIDVEGGFTLLSPMDGLVEYSRNGNAPGVLLPDQTWSLVFDWDTGLGVTIMPPPSADAPPFADADLLIFDGDPRMESGSREVQTGNHLVSVSGDSQIYISGILEDDLLRNSAGSIVYVFSAEADLP